MPCQWRKAVKINTEISKITTARSPYYSSFKFYISKITLTDLPYGIFHIMKTEV